jgi:Leucine-rich repeat (LRR) protein
MLSRRLAQYFFGLVFLASSSFAFSNTQFTYNVIQEGIEVTGCVDECPDDLIIPEEIDGYSVVSIGELAFDNIGLTALILPNTLQYIGSWAFLRNQLTTLTIPTSVIEIGRSAFDLNQLVEVIIPEGVVRIERAAFGGNMLTSIVLPNSLEYLAGFNSNQISSLAIPNNVTHIGTEAFVYNNLESVVIPDSVEVIGSEAFSNNRLSTVSLPLGLKEIDHVAFNNNQLTTVTIPDSVTFIGYNAFDQNQLTNVDFVGDLPDIEFNSFAGNPGLSSEEFRYLPLGDSALMLGCVDICPSDLVIPHEVGGYGIIGIDQFAFEGNQLTSVSIPSSVEFIGLYAFANNQLSTLNIPDSVSFIENGAFSHNQLTSLNLPNSLTGIEGSSFSYNQLASVTIPNSVLGIGRSAFENNQLTSVTIPDSVTMVLESAFASNQLTSVSIPNSISVIREKTFKNNQLISVAISNTVTDIDAHAFENNQLTTVTIPDSVSKIGEGAFANNQLNNLIIPNSLSEIGARAFAGNKLTQVTIPDSIDAIEGSVFRSNQLTSVTIPDNIIDIGQYAFQSNHIENISFSGNRPQMANGEVVWRSFGDGAFIGDGAEMVGNTFMFPLTAQDWAGFANDNLSMYPLSFPDGGIISFTASSEQPVNVKFRFEYMPWPDVSPDFETELVEINGACETYSVEFPSQGDNTFSSFLMFVVERNIPVTIENVVIGGDAPTCDSDAGNNNVAFTSFEENPIQNIYFCSGTTGWPGEPINGITPQLDENCGFQSDSDSDGDGILDSVDPDPLDSELLYYSVSDISNLVPDQTLRDCLINLASGAEGLGHISDVYCSSRNDDAEDLTPIASLEGLQYFPNLTHLWIDSSQISSLAPISNLINLVSLIVDNGQNSVSDLTPLLALNNLEFLHLQNGSLTEDMLQPITQLSKLKQLGLFENQIEDISFLTSLGNDIEELHVAGNPIQDFSPVASLTSLKKFYGYYNPMDNLNYLSDLQNLEVIGISETGISDITVLKDLPNLIDVTLNGNPIRRVSGIFTNMQSGSINLNNTQIWCYEYDELMAEIATDVEVIYDSSCILDSDQDGFSDQFETDYGLDPFTATLDIDQDGVPNEDDSDNDNDGLPDENDFAPFDPSNESESIIVFENGIVGAEWDDGIRAYDESIDWNSCLVPEGCPNIDWIIVNDEQRGNVLEVTHLGSDSGAGIFISTSNSVDLRGARENGVLRFDIKVLEGSSDLFISADCGWPCAGGLQRVQGSNQNEWQSLFISVEDLIPNGPNGNQLDLNIVKSAIVIEVGQGSSFRIDNIIYDCQSATCDGSNLPINEDAEFTYEFIEDGIELTGCQGECPSELIIPESIDGYAVTSIGYRAFYNNVGSIRINTVHIPSSIKVIGMGAFQHNSLETLIIPEGVVRIEDQAFLNNSLISVILPDTMNFIGSGAFLANNLTSINNLNQSIIFGDGDQGSFDVNPGIDNGEWRYFPLLDEVILFGCSQECSTDLVIPEYIDDLKVIRIGEGAFANQQLNSVIIPPNVSQIGVFAFAENNLTTVNLPIGLELISQGAFESNPLETIYYCDETYNGGDIDGITPQYNESCDLGQGNDDVSSPYQSVAITGEPVGLLGENLQLTVSYDVSDGEDDLTGLGLRMHYDSSVLTFVTFDSVLESNNISALGPIQDTQDIDNDSSTDQYISASWASLYIDWPGGLPADLFNAIFKVSNNETLSQTDINFSAISTTAGYGFSGEPYNLNIIAGSWDFDGNGAVDALTDGLLLLRHAFGLSGSTLTDFAVSPDSPNTATEIETHMNRIMSIADIDGDGNVDALTDGLLLLRYAFELRGDNLVANVISDNATRTSSTDIESYIDAHMP